MSVPSNALPATSTSTTAWAALAPQVTVTSVTINSAPVVKFTVKDAAGVPIVGLGNKSKSATATVAGLTNIGFTLAKLVPGSTFNANGNTYNAEPSKWVSYLVTKPVTVAQAAGTLTATDSCNPAPATWCGTFPTTDTQGTLVDNGDGSYEYTFYRDPKQAAAIVASFTDSTDGLSKKADLGDLTFDATLTHRVGIQLGGNAPGTGSNTPNAVTVTPAVAMVRAANAVYEFRPDGAAVATTRSVVQLDSCSSCHDGKVLAHGSRKDPNYCVTCHTDQIKYSFNSGNAVMLADGITFAVQTGTNAVVRPAQAIVDGRAVGNYPNMIHKTHMGEELVKQGYNFNNAAEGVYNGFGLPQSPANCTKCHTGTAGASTLTAKVTANGNNWMNNPSIVACGACHDGINFATGTGITLADKAAGVTDMALGSGHDGGRVGAKLDNTTCNMCHDATTIPVYHRTDFATPNNPTAKAGLVNFAYDIPAGGVSVNASGQPVIKFQIKKDGIAVTSFAVPTLVSHAVTGQQVVSPTYEPITGFAGGPSLYMVYSVAQDGVTAPADFNGRVSVSLTNLLVPVGTSPNAGTLTGPDASGYFTATLTGDLVGQPVGAGCVAPVAPAVATCVNKAVATSPILIPASAKMATGAIFSSFTQKGLAATPYVAANVSVNPTTAASGGLARPALLKKLVATGYTARRVIVDGAKCNTCHDQLGTSPSFHGGARNDPTACAMCHNPNQVNDNLPTAFGWPGASNTYIHGIHGASKRTVPFTYAAWEGFTVDDNYSKIGYPGVLKDCNQCHAPNTVNFGANGMALVPNLFPTTTAAGTTVDPATTLVSPYVAQTAGTAYGNTASVNAQGVLTPAAATTLVNSPISSACFSCHDTPSARNHMTSNGGSVYERRDIAATKGEACLVCHGAGRISDVVVMHQ